MEDAANLLDSRTPFLIHTCQLLWPQCFVERILGDAGPGDL